MENIVKKIGRRISKGAGPAQAPFLSAKKGRDRKTIGTVTKRRITACFTNSDGNVSIFAAGQPPYPIGQTPTFERSSSCQEHLTAVTARSKDRFPALASETPRQKADILPFRLRATEVILPTRVHNCIEAASFCALQRNNLPTQFLCLRR